LRVESMSRYTCMHILDKYELCMETGSNDVAFASAFYRVVSVYFIWDALIFALAKTLHTLETIWTMEKNALLLLVSGYSFKILNLHGQNFLLVLLFSLHIENTCIGNKIYFDVKLMYVHCTLCNDSLPL
jgi:hypothetical protein